MVRAEQSRAEQRESYYLLTDEESKRLNILKLWLSIMKKCCTMYKRFLRDSFRRLRPFNYSFIFLCQ